MVAIKAKWMGGQWWFNSLGIGENVWAANTTFWPLEGTCALVHLQLLFSLAILELLVFCPSPCSCSCSGSASVFVSVLVLVLLLLHYNTEYIRERPTSYRLLLWSSAAPCQVLPLCFTGTEQVRAHTSCRPERSGSCIESLSGKHQKKPI
jgi:hypothetical protein